MFDDRGRTDRFCFDVLKLLVNVLRSDHRPSEMPGECVCEIDDSSQRVVEFVRHISCHHADRCLALPLLAQITSDNLHEPYYLSRLISSMKPGLILSA